MRGGFGHLDETNRYIVEDHMRNPRNAEPIDGGNASATIDNPFCGDEVRVELRLSDAEVKAIFVQGTGCAITQASASIMAELVDGKDVSEIQDISSAVRGMFSNREALDPADEEKIGDAIVLRDVSRFPIRVKCALLPWATLEDAIAGD